MFKSPHLSKVFWCALLFIYIYLLIAIYAIASLPENFFELDSQEQVMLAFRLSYIRFAIITFALAAYPIALFTSLKYAKYITISLTAWAVAMYIDDHLVLYRVIEYPERALVTVLLTLRPVLLAGLIWMSFELTYTKFQAN